MRGHPYATPEWRPRKSYLFFLLKLGQFPLPTPQERKKRKSRKAGKQESRKAGKLLERSGCPHIPPGGYVYNSSAPKQHPEWRPRKSYLFFLLKLGQFPLPTCQNEKKEKRNRQESARKRPPRVAAAKKLSIFSSKIGPVPSGNLPKRKK